MPPKAARPKAARAAPPKAPRTGPKGKQKYRHPYTGKRTLSREYGLLRNGVSRVPALFIFLEVLCANLLQLFTHVGLVICVVLEAFGASGGPVGIGAGCNSAVTYRLSVFAYDSFLGLTYALMTLVRLLGISPASFPSGATSVSWLRLAVLQGSIASGLHFSSMARWQQLPSDFLAPPLLPCLAYFLAPWSTFSVWLVNVQPGDHAAGLGVQDELLLISLLFAARFLFFGRHGFPRMPKGGRHSIKSRLVDLFILGSVTSLFDYMVLHSSWLERRHNWKYVFCAANLLWPLFYGAPIITSFRHQGQFTRSDRKDVISEKPKPPASLSRAQPVAPVQTPAQLPVAGLPSSVTAGIHTKVRPRRLAEDVCANGHSMRPDEKFCSECSSMRKDAYAWQ